MIKAFWGNRLTLAASSHWGKWNERTCLELAVVFHPCQSFSASNSFHSWKTLHLPLPFLHHYNCSEGLSSPWHCPCILDYRMPCRERERAGDGEWITAYDVYLQTCSCVDAAKPAVIQHVTARASLCHTQPLSVISSPLGWLCVGISLSMSVCQLCRVTVVFFFLN